MPKASSPAAILLAVDVRADTAALARALAANHSLLASRYPLGAVFGVDGEPPDPEYDYHQEAATALRAWLEDQAREAHRGSS